MDLHASYLCFPASVLLNFSASETLATQWPGTTYSFNSRYGPDNEKGPTGYRFKKSCRHNSESSDFPALHMQKAREVRGPEQVALHDLGNSAVGRYGQLHVCFHDPESLDSAQHRSNSINYNSAIETFPDSCPEAWSSRQQALSVAIHRARLATNHSVGFQTSVPRMHMQACCDWARSLEAALQPFSHAIPQILSLPI